MERSLEDTGYVMNAKGEIPGFGPAHEFLKKYHSDPSLQAELGAQSLYRQLIDKASVCSFCGVGCPFTLIQGSKGTDKLIPLSSLGLCIKGKTSLLTGGYEAREQRLHKRGLESDRITTPMIRGHDGKMREVSWEEALDRAAWLFLHTREWVGPEAIAIYGNGQKTIESIWMASLYRLVFNIATIGANSEHCLASAGAAHEQNFGNEASFTWQQFDELEHCDVVVLHGTNPVITFPQAYEKLKANERAIKVVIDPVQSDTVHELVKHDPRTLHIRFEQGADILFNLSVARVIFENGWEDRDYLSHAVDAESLAAYRELCMQERCLPENVAASIALAGDEPQQLAQTIRDYAALLAQPNAQGERPRPAFISSMGINQSTGAYGFSSNLNLLLLTGNVGRKGAGSLRIAGQSNATSELSLGFNSRRLLFNLDPLNQEHREELSRLLDIPLHNIPARKGTPVARMADDDYLYCFIFIGTQMTRNMPRLGHWGRRMGRAFNIVIDSFLADGVLDHADVILPSLTYTERTGVIQRGDRSLQLQQGLTTAPPLAWSDEQILVHLALAIARRLQDPSTAALNELDSTVIQRTFEPYLDSQGKVDEAKVFQQVVEASDRLGMYNQFINDKGERISHDMLKRYAGQGVQWQGDGRYQAARENGAVFPGLKQGGVKAARLVCPPEALLKPLVRRGEEKLRSLITGRGRPGFKTAHYRGRYNSGVKTLPITGKEGTDYWLEVNPHYAHREGLVQDELVRISSYHGTVFAKLNLNPRVAEEFPFADFVPGEINRLTNYKESDAFTNQSLIKRTPVRIEKLGAEEAALCASAHAPSLSTCIDGLYQGFTDCYATQAAWEAYARGEEGSVDWLPLEDLQRADAPPLTKHLTSFAAFLQKYLSDKAYRDEARSVLLHMPSAQRERFLSILLPVLRKLDYHSALLMLLSDVVGPLRVLNSDNTVEEIDLKAAHQAAVLELKEEVVAAQLFVAIKRGLEILYGEDAVIPREDLAFVSGIAIPCAGDVPAFVMGIDPFELDARRLIHSRSIGVYSIIIVDRRRNRAVKMEIQTGVLPKDDELRKLRTAVIVKKRSASREQHRRFFDRLGELIVKFVHDGDANYHIVGPVQIPWAEYQAKLAFVPTAKDDYRDFLLKSAISPELAQALLQLEILDPEQDQALLEAISRGRSLDALAVQATQQSLADVLASNKLKCEEKIAIVIDNYIEPVLKNDGGRIEFLGFDEEQGEVKVRFQGSCANCPYSMLSLETLVIPPLMSIPGVTRVAHRGYLRDGEKNQLQQKMESPIQWKTA